MKSNVSVGRKLWNKWSKVYEKDFSEAAILGELNDEDYQAIGDSFLEGLSEEEDSKNVEKKVFEMFCIEHFQISFAVAHKVRYLVESKIIKEKRLWESFLSYNDDDYMAEQMVGHLECLNPEKDFRVTVKRSEEGFKVNIKCKPEVAEIYEVFDFFSQAVENNIKEFKQLYDDKVLKEEILNAG
jgi:hypothetical protein